MSWTAIKFLLRRFPIILVGLVLWDVFKNWDSTVASIKKIMADIKAKIDAAIAWVNDMIQPIKDAWEDAQDLYVRAIDYTTETLEKMFGDGADALDGDDGWDDKELVLAEKILEKEEQILEEKIKLDDFKEGSIEHQRGTAVIDRLEGESAVLKTALAEEKITDAKKTIEKHETEMEKIKQYAVDPAAASFIASTLADDKSVSLVQLPDGTYIRRANVSTDILKPEELQRQKDIIAENKDIILQEAPNIPSVAAATSPEKEYVQPGGVDETGQFIPDGGKQNEEFVPPGSVGADGKFTPDHIPSSSSKSGDSDAGVEKDKIKPSKEKEQQQQTEGTPPKVKSGTGADGPAGRHAKPKEDAIKKDEMAIDKKSEDVGPHHPQPGIPDPKPGDDWFIDEKGKLNIIIRGNKNTSTSITPGNLYSTVTGTYMPLLEKSLSVVTQNINRAMTNASIKKTSKNYNIDYGAVNPYQPLYKKVVNI
jgi:hypothetical protein